MSIPCPVHQPIGWARYHRDHCVDHRIDWTREAEIAKSCCPDCAKASDSPSGGEK